MAVHPELARDFASHSGFLYWQRTFALSTLLALACIATGLRGGRRPRAAVPLTLLAIVLSLGATWSLLALHTRASAPNPQQDPDAVFYPAPLRPVATIHLHRA